MTNTNGKRTRPTPPGCRTTDTFTNGKRRHADLVNRGCRGSNGSTFVAAVYNPALVIDPDRRCSEFTYSRYPRYSRLRSSWMPTKFILIGSGLAGGLLAA